MHCEEPTLSRSGQMHEGVVSAELGFTGYPSVAESVMVGRDVALAAYEGRPVHVLHVSARESVEAVRRAQADGVAATAEVTPHHLVLTDEALRSLDPNVKMNPPLRSADDRQALIDALRDGTICADRHRPRAARPPREGGAVRGGAVRRHGPRDGVLRALHAPRRSRASCRSRRCSSACRPGRPASTGSSRRASRPGAEANLVLLDTDATWRVTEDGFRSRSANSWLLGQELKGAVRMTVAAGRIVHEG